MRNVAAADLVAGPAVAQALAVDQEAARGLVVDLVRDLVQAAAVEAAAAQELDRGQAQEQEAVLGPALVMVQVLAADQEQAADTAAALALDLGLVACRAMAFAFISGATLTRRGRICTTLAP